MKHTICLNKGCRKIEFKGRLLKNGEMDCMIIHSPESLRPGVPRAKKWISGILLFRRLCAQHKADDWWERSCHNRPRHLRKARPQPAAFFGFSTKMGQVCSYSDCTPSSRDAKIYLWKKTVLSPCKLIWNKPRENN